MDTEDRYNKVVDQYSTVLTYEEALLIDTTLREALERETARIAFLGAEENNRAFGSNLRLKLLRSVDVMDKKRERADDMGG